MTNFEHIKSMNINELAEFFNGFTWEAISEVFCKEFCENCEGIDTQDIDGHCTEYAYCEVNGYKCRFVEDGTMTQEEYDNPMKWCLCKEFVNDSEEALTKQND